MGSKNGKGKTIEDGPRKFTSWIDQFILETEKLECPEIYRRWAGIVVIGSMLQQRAWLNVKGSVLYPNLYAFLVGPPGIGKSQTITAVSQYLPVEGFHLASTSVTGASLAIEMQDALIEIDTNTFFEDRMVFNSLLLMPDELQVLIPQYAHDLVGMLTAFYDCHPYSASRISRDPVEIESPQLSLLAGTTTSHLLGTLPHEAWDQGLMSRTIIIYSGAAAIGEDIFNTTGCYTPELAEDMLRIHSLIGQFEVTDEYRAIYNTWRKNGYPPAPTHPRLRHYCARRGAHLLKLSMIASADQGDDLVIRLPHFERALGWLCNAEAMMPYTFSDVSSPTTMAMDEALAQINGKTMTEGQLGRFLAARMPATQVPIAINIMVGAGQLKTIAVDANKQRVFRVTA
jgi:hypothetical protein